MLCSLIFLHFTAQMVHSVEEGNPPSGSATTAIHLSRAIPNYWYIYYLCFFIIIDMKHMDHLVEEGNPPSGCTTTVIAPVQRHFLVWGSGMWVINGWLSVEVGTPYSTPAGWVCDQNGLEPLSSMGLARQCRLGGEEF